MTRHRPELDPELDDDLLDAIEEDDEYDDEDPHTSVPFPWSDDDAR